jgi:phosphopantetheinyl transferase
MVGWTPFVRRHLRIGGNPVPRNLEKPFLLGSSAHISLSHSEHLVAAALHFNAPVGIDLEQPSIQLNRVAAKFLGEQERETAGEDLETLCKYWGIKEAVYKLVGERKISFRDHIRVLPSFSQEGWSATVDSPTVSVNASVYFEKIKGYYLTVALKTPAG